MATDNSTDQPARHSTRDPLKRILPGSTTEPISERAGLLATEAYLIENTLRLVEAALCSDNALGLIESHSVQSALCDLGQRINAVGEALEHLGCDALAAEKPTN